MKKILSILFILTAFTLQSFSQNATMRTTDKRTDKKVLADIAGNDTVSFNPDQYETLVLLALDDTATVFLQSKARARLNDRMKICITNTSGTGIVRIKPSTLFDYIGADSSVSVTASETLYLDYWFNGTKWDQSAVKAVH